MSEYEELLNKFDRSGMASWTRRFFDDLESAFQRDIGVIEENDWHGVICVGMGGSGAGGTYLSTISSKAAGLPVHYWRDYGLPSWWGPEWLVIATSYSGNTEETISSVEMALREGGSVVGISSGGRLGDLLEGSENSVHIVVPGGQMPRSAFGHLFGTQLSLFWCMGLLPAPSNQELEEMNARLRSSTEEWDPLVGTKAVDAARLISKSEIGIVTPSIMGCVASRFSCQLNENSNLFARCSEIPEMNHNEIIPWTEDSGKSQVLVLIRSDYEEARTSARIDWFQDEANFSDCLVLTGEGTSLVEQMLYLSHITDWISIVLAVSMGVDPSEMAAIPELKDHLGKI